MKITVGVLVALVFLGAFFLLSGTSGSASGYFPGATVIKNGVVPLQKKAKKVIPNPDTARDDRGPAFAEGCLDEKPVCYFGDTSSSTKVALLGDSHALQYVPAFDIIAKEKNWKIVLVAEGNCPYSNITIFPNCNAWRKEALGILEQQKPDLVVLATATKYWYSMKGTNKTAEARDATVEIMNELGANSDLLVMQDQTISRYSPTDRPGWCVKDNMSRLLSCAWTRDGKRETHDYDLKAAQKLGIPVIDVEGHVCRPNLCPIVIGNVIVNRDNYHYSATFMRTLVPWIRAQVEAKVQGL